MKKQKLLKGKYERKSSYPALPYMYKHNLDSSQLFMFLFCAPQRIAQSRTPTQIIQIAKQLRRRIPQAIQ